MISLELPEQPFTRDLEDVLRENRDAYRNAKPFPHFYVDGLFSEELLEKVVAEFPSEGSADWELRELEGGSKNKLITGPQQGTGPYTNYLFSLVSGPRFLRFVEELTGVPGLIGDPYLHGGGLHEIQRGGYLELHSDFNWHGHLRMYRRLNFLLYLNKDWKEEYGGDLELWDRRLREGTKYNPQWNRLVIQHVTSDAMHGFPSTIECPEGMTRKSMAMWYYTTQLPVDVQVGYDMCEPDFIRRDGKPHPLPRPLWRMLLPPVVTAFIKKKHQTKTYSPLEVKSAATRFLPPALVAGFQKLRGK